jgi:hypothetical protein
VLGQHRASGGVPLTGEGDVLGWLLRGEHSMRLVCFRTCCTVQSRQRHRTSAMDQHHAVITPSYNLQLVQKAEWPRINIGFTRCFLVVCEAEGQLLVQHPTSSQPPQRDKAQRRGRARQAKQESATRGGSETGIGYVSTYQRKRSPSSSTGSRIDIRPPRAGTATKTV